MRPGDVVWVELGPTTGKEQQGRRPAVVVGSDDHLLVATDMVIVVPCTGRDRGWINHIRLAGPTGLGADTFAMTEQPRTISRQRVRATTGTVTPDCLDELCAWLHRWIHGRDGSSPPGNR